MTRDGRSFRTTELAPITQRSPISTPLVTTQLAPNQQLEPIRTGPFEVKPCHVIGLSGSSKRCAASPTEQPLANITWSPISIRSFAASIVLRLRKQPSPTSICASAAIVIQHPGSKSAPSPIRSRPSSSASSSSPSTGKRMKSPPRAAWRLSRRRRSGRRFRSYQRRLRHHSLQPEESATASSFPEMRQIAAPHDPGREMTIQKQRGGRYWYYWLVIVGGTLFVIVYFATDGFRLGT